MFEICPDNRSRTVENDVGMDAGIIQIINHKSEGGGDLGQLHDRFFHAR